MFSIDGGANGDWKPDTRGVDDRMAKEICDILTRMMNEMMICGANSQTETY
jgi:hypothetical protein